MNTKLRLRTKIKSKSMTIEIFFPDIPNEIDNYHSLFLLETLAIHQKLPLPSSTYKATHVSTGIRYCLRRLHGNNIKRFRVNNMAINKR